MFYKSFPLNSAVIVVYFMLSGIYDIMSFFMKNIKMVLNQQLYHYKIFGAPNEYTETTYKMKISTNSKSKIVKRVLFINITFEV